MSQYVLRAVKLLSISGKSFQKAGTILAIIRLHWQQCK